MKLAFMNGWRDAPHAVIRNFWRVSVDRAPGNWTSVGFLGFVVFILH